MALSEKAQRELLLYKQKMKALNEHWTAEKHQAGLMKAIFNDGYKRIFIRGGRKSAKTESILYVATRMAALKGNQVCSIIGPSLKQQKKICWNNRRLQGFNPPGWTIEERKSDTMIRYPNGSFIEVDGSENSESHRGEEQDLLALDELKDHQYDSYNAMYPNLAARDGVLVVFGTPPKHKKNLYWELEQEAHRNPAWKFFHWTCWDNSNISKKWLEDEKAAHYARGDGHIWEIEYEANYVFGGKDAVFEVFNPQKHVIPLDVLQAEIEKDKNHLEYFIVTDPGNRVCHATLFIAYDRTNNYVWVMDEIYETEQRNTATGAIFPRIMAKAEELFPEDARPYHIYDEAALWYYTEVSNQFPDAPPMAPTNKAIKDKETSIGAIKDCMAANRYYQSDRCPGFEAEIMSYITDDMGRYPKHDDHAIDCLRYFFDYVGYNYQLSSKRAELTRKKLQETDGLLRGVTPQHDDYLLDEDDEDFGLWM